MILSAVALSLCTSAFLPINGTSLSLQESGGRNVTNSDRLRFATLSESKPETLKKLPEGLTAPLYCLLDVPGAKGRNYHVVVDEPAEGPSRLFVDGNGDGDLTNDGPTTWESRVRKNATGEFRDYMGGATLTFGALEGTGSRSWQGHILVTRPDKRDPRREATKMRLSFQRDYVLSGTVDIGGTSYKAALDDGNMSGDFRGGEGKTPDGKCTVRLFVDVNQNGSFDRRGESFAVTEPFKIGGKVFEISGLEADGSGLQVVASSKDAEEVLPPPDLRPGKPVLAFEAKDMEGKDVHFPGDFKGKVVLLDFWATWCGPCMGEMPNVSKAYADFHDQGFEILGVTLDRENATEAIRAAESKHTMKWPQIYDGKYWDAKIGRDYGIFSIPQAFLVDGDTGLVIATGADVRGEKLAETIKAALEAKKKRG
jgi:thiol-disulfide isomerase/thioredoxin